MVQNGPPGPPPALWLSHGFYQINWRIPSAMWLSHGTTPAGDKYPYMFKMIVVICTLGNPCVQFVEDTHRVYATQTQCLDRAAIKYQQLTQTLLREGYQLDRSGYYCVRDESI